MICLIKLKANDFYLSEKDFNKLNNKEKYNLIINILKETEAIIKNYKELKEKYNNNLDNLNTEIQKKDNEIKKLKKTNEIIFNIKYNLFMKDFNFENGAGSDIIYLKHLYAFGIGGGIGFNTNLKDIFLININLSFSANF